jgi:hypothetical protein
VAGAHQRIATVAVDGLGADLAAIDALARLALAARRSSCEVCLRGASSELLRMIELAGLSDVLHAESPGAGDSGLGCGEC